MRVLFTRRWLAIHLGLVVAVAACGALMWWQIVRAGEGNPRSLGYSFEWPTFAVILVVLWVRAMRDELRGSARPEVRVAAPEPAEPDWFDGLTREDIIAADEAEDPELAAYNRRLAALNASDQRRP